MGPRIRALMETLRQIGSWPRTHRKLFWMVVAYTLVLGSLSTYRYFAGLSDAWDLGIMQQSLYTAAFDGKLFFYTPELFNKNPSGSFWGVHFSLLMYPLAGFYRLLPFAPALLYLQAFVVALAVVPLAELLRTLQVPSVNLFSLLYLCSPLTVLSNLYDFHLEAFIPLGVFLLLLALLKRNFAWSLVGSVYLFSVYEYGSLFVLSAVLLFGFLNYRAVLSFLARPADSPPSTRRLMVACLALIGASLAFYFVSFEIIYAVNPVLQTLNGSYGPSSLSLSAAVTGNDSVKLFYFGLPLVLLGLFPLRDPRALVLAAPFAIPAIFSHTSYYEFGYQYGFLVIPGYVVAAGMGYARFRPRLKKLPLARFVKVGMASASVVGVVAIVVLASSVSASGWAGTGAVLNAPSAANQAEYRLSGLIPAGSSVLVDDNAFPWVANNLNAYVLPLDVQPSPVSYYSSINSTLHVNAQYILLNTVDFGLFPYFDNLSSFVDANYGPLAEDSGVILLQWHYHGSVIFYSGYQEFYPPQSFGYALNNSTYWSGPFAVTIVGNYSALVAYTSNLSRPVQVEVTAFHGRVLLQSVVIPIQATRPGSTASFAVSLRSPFMYDNVEILVKTAPNLHMGIAGATLVQTGP